MRNMGLRNRLPEDDMWVMVVSAELGAMAQRM